MTNIKKPLKVRDINFNDIWATHLSVFVDDKEVATGFIGEVLKKIPHLADSEVKSTNYYFNAYVIRL